ncbi:hypothetical protein JOM56_002179 [Amanita muscaria]
MYSQEYRTLWCFLKDDPYPYDIYIPIGASVNRLKLAIKQRIEFPIGPDDGLPQRFEILNLATCSQLLSAEEQVGELFPEPHSQKHFHIVVQLSEAIEAIETFLVCTVLHTAQSAHSLPLTKSSHQNMLDLDWSKCSDLVVHPEYSVIHVGVELVDSRLACKQ